MPLHLLGKKSWNVYNPDNIERVRRDEAKARAEAIEQERSKQDTDSDRRLALLRGEDADLLDSGTANAGDPEATGSSQVAPRAADSKATNRDRKLDIHPMNEGVRLSDALGYGSNVSQPWYRTTPTEGQFESRNTGRDVWGNEGPRRQEREQQRMSSNDPLAAMKKGVKQLRKAESERREWKAQRERDLNEVEEMARKEHGHRRRRRRRNSDADSIEDLDLDRGYRDRDESRRNKSDEKHSRRHRHSHHDRHRDKESGRSERYRDRSRSPGRRNH